MELKKKPVTSSSKGTHFERKKVVKTWKQVKKIESLLWSARTDQERIWYTVRYMQKLEEYKNLWLRHFNSKRRHQVKLLNYLQQEVTSQSKS